MKRNMPFGSLNFVDKPFNKFILPSLDALDNGYLLKQFIIGLLNAFAFLLLIGGLYMSLIGIFGETGFLRQYILNDNLQAGDRIGASIGLLIGLAVSILTIWILYSVIRQRTVQMKELVYLNVIEFLFVKILPRFILLVGELFLVFMVYIGLLQVVAAIVGSGVYAPILNFYSFTFSMLPGFNLFPPMEMNSITSNYEIFGYSMQIGITTMLTGVFGLILSYVYKEVYCYILKIVSALIAYIPKFAIPVAIRMRNENLNHANPILIKNPTEHV